MHNNSRIYVLSGSASGIGRATKELLVSQGHSVIGVDLREADVIADLGTPAGRDLMIDQVTKKSRGKVDALLAVAGVDIAGPPTIAINYYGALATLEGLRPLLLKSSAPRAVAVSSITSVHPLDQQLLNAMLDGTEEEALHRAEVASYSYATSKRALSRWIRRVAVNAEWADSGIPLNAVAPGLVRRSCSLGSLQISTKSALSKWAAPCRLAAPLNLSRQPNCWHGWPVRRTAT